MSKCELCGEPMPKGEEMFKYHGYSGPCPKAVSRGDETPDPLGALEAAYTYITQPKRMTPTEVTYDVRNYNTLVSKLRAAINSSRISTS